MLLNRKLWYIAIVNALLFALLEPSIEWGLKQFFKIFFQTFGLFFVYFIFLAFYQLNLKIF